MASKMMTYLSHAGKNVKKLARTEDYIGAALKGAAIGAGISGTTEWAGGGSFIEGAKSGALTGAAAGAAVHTFNIGRLDPKGYTNKLSKLKETKSAITKNMSANDVTRAAKAPVEGVVDSKAVKELRLLNQNINRTSDIIKVKKSNYKSYSKLFPSD